MHLSMLIPGGKGAGNGWGFNHEFYPHRRAFVKDFLPGCGRFALRHNSTCMQFKYEAWSLESRKPEVRKLFIFYFRIRFCLLAFWNLNIVHSLVSEVWFLGIKFRMPRCFLWLFILNVIKIFCLDLSPGCVCFETFDYLRIPHQRAFDPIF